MRSIIHQLLVANPEIASLVESDVDKAGEMLMENVSQLGSIFKKAAETGFAGRVVCALDALDECEPGELDTLIRWLGLFSPPYGRRYLERQVRCHFPGTTAHPRQV
jgi:hypothetical protein